jgi:hypothetical protein
VFLILISYEMSAENVWSQNDKGVKVISLTDERLKEALALMRDSYYPDESAAKGVQLLVS